MESNGWIERGAPPRQGILTVAIYCGNQVKGLWWVTFRTVLCLFGLSYVVGFVASMAMEEVSTWLYMLPFEYFPSGSDVAWIACNAGFVASEVLFDIILLFADVGMAVFCFRRVETLREEKSILRCGKTQ